MLSYFKSLTAKWLYCLIVLDVLLYVTATASALFLSPIDYRQGELVRIMYIHVPAAWLALSIYVIMALLNTFSVVYKNNLANIMSYAAAPIGAVSTIICLITGSIWGYSAWGTWWVWDARLTSMLILLFLYLGYMIIWDNNEIALRSAAILNIFGAINIPIIKFSVDIWNTLHQPASIIRSGGMAISSSMLIPLLLMFCAYTGLFLILWILRTHTILNTLRFERYNIQRSILHEGK